MIPRQILVVEDDPSVRRLISASLEAQGYEVLEAAHAEPALQVLRERPVDLVCLDLTLPVHSGFELIETIRGQLQSAVPILVVSARTSPLDRAEARQAGANAYLTKPFAVRDLTVLVQGLLEGPLSPPARGKAS